MVKRVSVFMIILVFFPALLLPRFPVSAAQIISDYDWYTSGKDISDVDYSPEVSYPYFIELSWLDLNGDETWRARRTFDYNCDLFFTDNFSVFCVRTSDLALNCSDDSILTTQGNLFWRYSDYFIPSGETYRFSYDYAYPGGRWVVRSTNMSFSDEDGNVYGNPDPAWEDNRAVIMQPNDGFSQSQLRRVVTKVAYHVPYDGDKNHLKVSMLGYDSGTAEITDATFYDYGTFCEGTYVFEGTVPYGDVTLTFSVTDCNGTVYTDSITIHVYSDFVDEDGDGFDDRSHQDYWQGGGDSVNPPVDSGGDSTGIWQFPAKPTDGNVLDWIGWFVDCVAEFFRGLGRGCMRIFDAASAFFNFLSSTFSFLPTEIWVIISLSLVVGIIVFVLRR